MVWSLICTWCSLFTVQCSVSLLPNLMIVLVMKLDESVLIWWVSVISDENSHESIWIIFSSSCWYNFAENSELQYWYAVEAFPTLFPFLRIKSEIMGLFIAPLKMTAVPWWKALPGQWKTAPNIGFCQSWSACFQKIFTSETEMYVKLLRTANSRLGST